MTPEEESNVREFLREHRLQFERFQANLALLHDHWAEDLHQMPESQQDSYQGMLLYCNPNTQQAFSLDVLATQSTEWVEEKVHKPNATGDWQVFSNLSSTELTAAIEHLKAHFDTYSR